MRTLFFVLFLKLMDIEIHAQNQFNILTGAASINNIATVYQGFNKTVDVIVYPQPAVSYLKIKSSTYNQYILFDEKGIIYKRGWIDETETIEKKNIPSGIYFLKLANSNGDIYYRKIIFN